MSTSGAIAAVVRASDDALRLRRWKPHGNASESVDAQPEHAAWISSARTEQLVAARLGIEVPASPPMLWRLLRHDADLPADIAPDDDVTLVIGSRLARGQMERLCAFLHDRPQTAVRVFGDAAVLLLESLARTPLRRLTIAAPFDRVPSSPCVTDLCVTARGSLEAIVAAYPNLSTLRWSGGGARFDPRPLRDLKQLVALECREVALTTPQFPPVAVLRLVRSSGVSDAAAVAMPSLRSLALEHLYDLTSLRDLQACENVEQIVLRGLWQFDVASGAFALQLPRLVRAEIDFGGRRKNVELYRRSRWAYPWPFPA